MADTESKAAPSLKVVELKKPKVSHEAARLPTEDEIKEITEGQALSRVVVAFVTEGGLFGHFIDGATLHEAVGMAADLQHGLLLNARVEGEVE